jgi:putative DNA primase/helicase
MEANIVSSDRPMEISRDVDDSWLAHMEFEGEYGDEFVVVDGKDEVVTAGRLVWDSFVETVYKTKKDEDGVEILVSDSNGKKQVKSMHFSYTRFGEWLLNESGEHYVTLEDNGGMYYYKEGVYMEGGDNRIRYILYNVLQCDMANNRNFSEVLSFVRANTSAKRDEFDTNTDVINLQNGIYYISNGRFTPHTPKYRSFSKLDIIYDIDAKCPLIDWFIDDVVEPDRVQAMYEIFGYSMMSRKTLKRGLIFTGQSDTGKSTMLTLMLSMVGKENVSTVSPTIMGDDVHSTFDIYGKLLNIVDDLGTAPIRETGVIKSIISSKPIRANQKYGTPFLFTPRALIVFACNRVPMCSDEYLRDKFDILEFNHRVEDGKQNTDLDKLLSADSERSGLFLKAMDAVKTAIKNKTFTGADTIEARDTRYVYKSVPVAEFIDTCCDTSDPEAYIDKKVFRQMYVEWSKDNGIRVISVSDQTTFLGDMGCMLTRVGGHGDQVWVYNGIAPKMDGVFASGAQDETTGHGDTDVTVDNVAAAIYITTYTRGKKTFNPVDILMSINRDARATIDSVTEVMQAHSQELKITCVDGEWTTISG